jgi:ubiquinone/menaquinone biosynthesis C-methylase UbiE
MVSVMSEPQRKSDPGDYFKDISVAENYDRYIGTNIPYYRSAINAICEILSDMHGRAAPDLTAVEFGSGTGNVTVSLLQQVGLGKVLMVDHSQGMLTVALEKIRKLGLPETSAIALAGCGKTLPSEERP